MIKIKTTLAFLLLASLLVAWNAPLQCADGRNPIMTGGGILICPNGWDTNR